MHHSPSHHSHGAYSPLILSPSAPVLALHEPLWQQQGVWPPTHDVPLPGMGNNYSQGGYYPPVPSSMHPYPTQQAQDPAPAPAPAHHPVVRTNSRPMVKVVPSHSASDLNQSPAQQGAPSGMQPRGVQQGGSAVPVARSRFAPEPESLMPPSEYEVGHLPWSHRQGRRQRGPSKACKSMLLQSARQWQNPGPASYLDAYCCVAIHVRATCSGPQVVYRTVFARITV